MQDDVDLRGGQSPTQELERNIKGFAAAENNLKEELVESLSIARRKVVDAAEAWDYAQRLRNSCQGRPPSDDEVALAREVFFKFCIKPQSRLPADDTAVAVEQNHVPRSQNAGEEDDEGRLHVAEEIADVREDTPRSQNASDEYNEGRLHMVEEEDEIIGFDSGLAKTAHIREEDDDGIEEYHDLGEEAAKQEDGQMTVEGLMDAAWSFHELPFEVCFYMPARADSYDGHLSA